MNIAFSILKIKTQLLFNISIVLGPVLTISLKETLPSRKVGIPSIKIGKVMKINPIDTSNYLDGSKDVLIQEETRVQNELAATNLMRKRTNDEIDPSEDGVMVRKSSSSNMNNITKSIRREGERMLINIKTVKSRLNSGLTLLKIAPSVPNTRVKIFITSNRVKNIFRV